MFTVCSSEPERALLTELDAEPTSARSSCASAWPVSRKTFVSLGLKTNPLTSCLTLTFGNAQGGAL